MTNGRTIARISNSMKENFWLYIIGILFIFTGIVIGIYTVKYMGDFEKNDLLSYLKNFSLSVHDGKLSNKAVFIQSLKNNLPMILAIWFLGLTMVGIPVILVFDIIKGFTVGFSISFIIKGMGGKGLTVVLLGLLPQNIIYIPCVLAASVIAMNFSLTILKDKINRQWSTNIWMKIASYSFLFAIICVLMTLGSIIEAYLTPNLVKLVV
jgi:stage II sporulation protein M